MKQEIIGYKCKNCSRRKGEHQANTLNCPARRKQNKVSTVYSNNVYEPNEQKPIYGFRI